MAIHCKGSTTERCWADTTPDQWSLIRSVRYQPESIISDGEVVKVKPVGDPGQSGRRSIKRRGRITDDGGAVEGAPTHRCRLCGAGWSQEDTCRWSHRWC